MSAPFGLYSTPSTRAPNLSARWTSHLAGAQPISRTDEPASGGAYRANAPISARSNSSAGSGRTGGRAFAQMYSSSQNVWSARGRATSREYMREAELWLLDDARILGGGQQFTIRL